MPKQSKQIQLVENGIPIGAGRFKAIALACSDTWALAWLLLGTVLTISSILTFLNNTQPPPPGAFERLWILILGYWLITSAMIAPRYFHTFSIARRGIFVLGVVEYSSIFGIVPRSSIRLNVIYTISGHRYLAKASVLGKVPDDGSRILVAIHPNKPNRYRVVPYDFRLFKPTINALKQKLISTES